MRRGFKTEARQIGEQVRSELGLTELQPLDPWLLAEHLDIPILPLTELGDESPKCVATLTGPEEGAFSAMVAFTGRRRIIVHNDAHARTRQRADISHEIAHILLIHEPHPASPGEPLLYDQDQEDEAGWLGAVLLVPDAACLHACRNDHSVPDAARRLGVSVQLMQWRLNSSGARARVARSRARGR
jgi:Zn-dependent peptidase ImmA (M78 family)